MSKTQIVNTDQTDRLAEIQSLRATALTNYRKTLLSDEDALGCRVSASQFTVGDMVMVERSPILKGVTSGKLVQKYIGPIKACLAGPLSLNSRVQDMLIR
ncbi:hypothetical protein NQ315_016033 [Exocentrus adspersus]|uniref:Uncharacterized protein n=1 Tax=Exocentrus adspersus TaxID=1586481 RepID=A0AAV8V939_9CUCU|nr:hypothetical protein NQ315_016033 [Exocentrus adspersus]